MTTVPRTWLAMRNYVKVLVVLFIIFEVIAVIFTLERRDEDHNPQYNTIETTNVTLDRFLNNNNNTTNRSTTNRSASRESKPQSLLDKILRLPLFNHAPDSNPDSTLQTPTTNYSPHSVTTELSLPDVTTWSNNLTIISTTEWPIKPDNSSEYVSLPLNVVSYLLKAINLISNSNEESPATERNLEDASKEFSVDTIINEFSSKFTTTLKSVLDHSEGLEDDESSSIKSILSDLDQFYNRLTTENSTSTTKQTIDEEETLPRPASTPSTTEENSNVLDHVLQPHTEHPVIRNETKKAASSKKHHGLKVLEDILSLFHKKGEDHITTSSTERVPTTSESDGLFRSSSEYDTVAVIRGAGYPVETYRVQTEDGYILTVYRIPPTLPASRPARKKWLPVYLQHGLWSSSYHWFETKPQFSLPLILSDAGFDVWIGNCRGNVISQEHAFLSTATDSTYWDFSFHEMGIYDLPATIELVLNVTKKSQIHYIGHSMGTTMFFVMASLRPEVARKVHFMLALAPIATVGPIRNLFRWMILFERFILTREKPVAFLTKNGISLKTVLHYVQLYVTGKFAMYDFGKMANMDIYKSAVPPTYDLTSITLPIVLCYGNKDPFVRFEDLITLHSSLGNSLGMWPVPLTHFQFAGGEEAKDYLYNYIPLHLH